MANSNSNTENQKAKMDTNNAQAELKAKVTGLEGWLDGIFGAKFPIQLPKAAKDWLVMVAPWLALVGGILSLWATWNFWHVGHTVNSLVNWANNLSIAYGGQAVSHHLGFAWYLAVVIYAIEGVLMLLAFSGLRDRKKHGWDLLFYSSLASVVLAVVYLFVNGYGFADFLSSAVGAAVGWFLLFQVRGYYKKG